LTLFTSSLVLSWIQTDQNGWYDQRSNGDGSTPKNETKENLVLKRMFFFINGENKFSAKLTSSFLVVKAFSKKLFPIYWQLLKEWEKGVQHSALSIAFYPDMHRV